MPSISGFSQKVVVNPASSAVSVVNAGPQGPPGASALPAGGVDGQVLGKLGTTTQWLDIGTTDEIDTKIAAHATAEVSHTQSTSGRDFVALFQNGLI